VALCQARTSTKPLWGLSSSNPYHPSHVPNKSFDPCLSCVIKLMTVFCVQLVLERQQQQLDLPEARS
jgi:hypothetical protein